MSRAFWSVAALAGVAAALSLTLTHDKHVAAAIVTWIALGVALCGMIDIHGGDGPVKPA